MHRNFNDLKIETMELKEKIENYTHYITDQSENKWKVIETSDLEDLMESYHQAKLKLLGISGVSVSFEEGYEKGWREATTEACKEIAKNYHPNER